MNALSPPPEALTDPKAVEFARIWAAHSQQHVSLRVEQWKHNPGVWGIMLSDLAHHVANAYEQEGVGTREEVLQVIVSVFLAEFAEPTDTPTGGMLQPQ